MRIWDFHPKESKTLRGIDLPTLTLNRVIMWLKRKEQLNDMNFVKCRKKKKTRLLLSRERGRSAALWVEQLELEVIVRSQCIHRAIRKNNVHYVGQYPSALFLHPVNFLKLGNIKMVKEVSVDMVRFRGQRELSRGYVYAQICIHLDTHVSGRVKRANYTGLHFLVYHVPDTVLGMLNRHCLISYNVRGLLSPNISPNFGLTKSKKT